MTLRGTCRAFREWTLEQFDRRRIYEINFSNFNALKRKFETTRSGVARRLVEDFPCLTKTRIEIYLGNPGMRLELLLEFDSRKSSSCASKSRLLKWKMLA